MSRIRLIAMLPWLLAYGMAARAQSPQAEPAAAASTTPPALTAPADAAPAAQPAEPARTPPPAKSRTAAAVDGSRTPSDSARGPKGNDRLELGTTEISGNRELPKVLYVVPWRRAEIGDAVGRPPNSLVEEALTPVDRDVFRRQNRYYATLEAGTAPSKSQPAAGGAVAPHAAPKDEK